MQRIAKKLLSISEQLESMRCKVLDKWEEMNTQETVKKEIVVYAVTVHIMANILKKLQAKKKKI